MDKITELTPEVEAVLIIAARKNFWCFCCYWDWEFFRIRRRFLKDIALLLQEVSDEYDKGHAISVSASLPPRSGKSYIASLFAAWWLGKNPTLSVMRNTCTASLYQEFSYVTRNIIQSDKFRAVFNVQLKKDKQNLDGWSLDTSKQVGYFGGGVGTSIIGKGANLAMSDDLYSSMKDAMSDTVRQSVDLWKSSVHNSRMEKNCPEIFIGTRWGKYDVIGKAMESGKIVKSVVIPALIDDKSFCEDVKSTQEYLSIRDEEGEDSITWQAEYMQQPVEVKGLLLPASELHYDNLSNLNPRNYIYRFEVIDPADNGGDKFASPICYVSSSDKGIAVYIPDALCNTDGIMANTPVVVQKCKTHAIEDLFIESNGVGLASIVDLHDKVEDFTEIKPFYSSEEKEVRIMSNFEFIKKYFIFNSEQTAEYKSFMQDLTSYVKGGQNLHKKDAIDVLSRVAEIIKLKYFDEIY